MGIGASSSLNASWQASHPQNEGHMLLKVGVGKRSLLVAFHSLSNRHLFFLQIDSFESEV